MTSQNPDSILQATYAKKNFPVSSYGSESRHIQN